MLAQGVNNALLVVQNALTPSASKVSNTIYIYIFIFIYMSTVEPFLFILDSLTSSLFLHFKAIADCCAAGLIMQKFEDAQLVVNITRHEVWYT